MNDVRFEWDDDKNEINIQKHKISFIEAITVFDDDNILYEPDSEHSINEERFNAIGISRERRLLIVCHCYRESDTVIRIISARKANKNEWDKYGGGLYEE